MVKGRIGQVQSLTQKKISVMKNTTLLSILAPVFLMSDPIFT